VRRALLGAVDQAEAMTAVVGTDPAFWHDGIGLFGAGTPLANDAGIEVLRGPRDYAAVRQALAHAGIMAKRSSYSPRPTPKEIVRYPWPEPTSCAVPG
jgi:peptide/nickel transport system substrate-binding protein